MYRKPRYQTDSDYTTNAPSYYDDLARKNELMKHLAKRVWEYDKKLFKSLEEVEKVLSEVVHKIGEGFNQEIEKLLIQWVEDGTLDHIINETLMNKKADITYVDVIYNELYNEISQVDVIYNELYNELYNEISQIGTTIFVRG